MKRPAAIVALALAAASVAAVSAQSVVITGRVVADDSGDPIPNARVTLAGVKAGAPVTLTDAGGNFRFAAPTLDRYTVAVEKTGFARREAAAGGGSSIEVRLQRGAAISGTVTDEFGEPVLGARIGAETRAGPASTPTMIATTDTDENGEFRLAGLAAGSVFVAVETVGASAPVQITPTQTVISARFFRTYYPGTTDSKSAEDLRLQPGEQRRSIDFVIPAAQAAGGPAFGAVTIGPLGRPFAVKSGVVSSAALRGHVVGRDGRGLGYAQVRLVLSTDLAQSRVERADRNGRFEFVDLPPGRFEIYAAKTGYASGNPADAFRQSNVLRPSGPSITLSEGEIRDNVDVTLTRWSSVSGRLVDENGDALQGAQVQLLQVWYENGRRRLVPAASSSRLTDDLGRYRIHSVPPGQYVVSATASDVGSAELPGYARTYYPGTSASSNAQFVAVGVGQDVPGIDFALSRTPTARIAGKLIDAAGEPTTGGRLVLVAARTSASGASIPVGARILPDGTFEFANVTPGQYVIQADRGRKNPSTEGEFASLPVAVGDGDVVGLVVQMSSGSAIAGRILFDNFSNGAPLPTRSAIHLTPVPVDADTSPRNVAEADIQPDWTFHLGGINGARRLQLMRVPDGWTLKEIRAGGADITDRAVSFGRADQSLANVEVILTNRISQLNGAVVDDDAHPVAGPTVVVFPVDRDRWYLESRFVRRAVAGRDGAFSIAGLPFGSYYAAALRRLPDDGPDAWRDPEFLDGLIPGAVAVSVAEGQTRTISVIARQ